MSLVSLPQRFSRTQVVTPTPVSYVAQEWKTRSAFIDTNESGEELLFFSQYQEEKVLFNSGLLLFCVQGLRLL
jgi:hypothetical protein